MNLNSADAYRLRGLSYDRQDKDELAIANYSQALKINPDFAKVYKLRGEVYAAQGKYELAIADYNQALIIDPNDDVWAYKLRGGVYYELARNNFEKAKRLLLAQGDVASAEELDSILIKLP